MQRFNEKLVVISGGASGMGALTAKRVVEEGGTAITPVSYTHLTLPTICSV